jgi:SAM-dependent methyltransferase
MEYSNSYDGIAREYYEERHITSRNFDVATLDYLEKRGCFIPSSGFVLDLGCGRGKASLYCKVDPNRLIQADISENMLLLQHREPARIRIRCNALSLPFQNMKFAAVVAFLYDPYNKEMLYREIFRILDHRGVFIGTLPNYEWGRMLRIKRGYDLKKARFVSRAGSMIDRDSILMSKEEIRNILSEKGFDQIEIESLKLPISQKKISPDIIDPAQELDISPYNLEIIELIIARKES